MTEKATKKTTRSRPRKKTVAQPQEVARESEAVATATADVVEEPTTPVAAEPSTPNDVVAVAADPTDKGYCDNHPSRRAILVTNFPWTRVQRFCNFCIPSQYRYLLP